MTKEVPPECNDLAAARRIIDTMKDAFADAIEARQAELREKEVYGRRAGWARLVLRKPR